MTPWEKAIGEMESQVERWVPSGVSVKRQDWVEDPSIKVLVLEREGRRVYLQPAAWKRGEVPTAADLVSARGSRMRLQGPYEEGNWGSSLPISSIFG